MTSSGGQSVPTFEGTNEGVFPSTTESTALGDYSSEVSVTRDLSVESVLVLSLQKELEEPCEDRPQGLCFVHRPQRPSTDAVYYQARPRSTCFPTMFS
jgi:hypothetical protein